MKVVSRPVSSTRTRPTGRPSQPLQHERLDAWVEGVPLRCHPLLEDGSKKLETRGAGANCNDDSN